MKTFAIIVTTVALNLSGLSIAQAAGTDDSPSVTVRFGDLDLTSNEGFSSLYTRLSQAARSVCREQGPDYAILGHRYKSCINEAIQGAVAKINRPAFTDYVSTKMTLPANPTGVKLAAK